MRVAEQTVLVTCCALILFLTTAERNYLLLFRGKSKHTSLIAPFDKWFVPEEELRNCYGDQFKEHFSTESESIPIGKGGTFRKLISNTIYQEGIQGTASVQSVEESLIYASQKCILLHGLYEIWSEGSSVEEVVRRAESSIQYRTLLLAHEEWKVNYVENKNDTSYMKRSVDINVAASVLEQPWLSSEKLNKDILSRFHHLWRRLDIIPAPIANLAAEAETVNTIADISRYGDVKTKERVDNNIDTNISESKPRTLKGKARDRDTDSQTLEMRIYVDEVTGHCVLCRQLGKGLASPLHSGLLCSIVLYYIMLYCICI